MIKIDIVWLIGFKFNFYLGLTGLFLSALMKFNWFIDITIVNDVLNYEIKLYSQKIRLKKRKRKGRGKGVFPHPDLWTNLLKEECNNIY